MNDDLNQPTVDWNRRILNVSFGILGLDFLLMFALLVIGGPGAALLGALLFSVGSFLAWVWTMAIAEEKEVPSLTCLWVTMIYGAQIAIHLLVAQVVVRAMP